VIIRRRSDRDVLGAVQRVEVREMRIIPERQDPGPLTCLGQELFGPERRMRDIWSWLRSPSLGPVAGESVDEDYTGRD
jgi:hypothetical protein